MRRTRQGFSLLEVMVAIGILVVSIVIVVQTETIAIKMTRDAERLVTATQLAQEKTTDVILLVEEEGFGDQDIGESGDFEDFGDEAFDLEFEDSLKDFHWEWWVSEVELGLSTDLNSLMGELAGTGYWPESEGAGGGGAAEGAPGLDMFGISDQMITDMLSMYIREVRVHVWWGDEQEEAEEEGNGIIITTHVINPTGKIVPGQSEDIDPNAGNETVPTTNPGTGPR